MQKPVRELRGLLAAYLTAGDRGAVVSDASVLTASSVLGATERVLADGSASVARHGLGLAAAFFLLRSRELHCAHEHAVAADFLDKGDEQWESMLTEAHDCLVGHVCRRLAYGSLAALLGAECELEVELLERVHGALTGSGAPGADGSAVYWLAQLRWHRFLMRAGNEAEDELTRALDGFAAVYVRGRMIAPPLVREYLQCLDPDAAPAGPAVSERFRSSSADGVHRPEAARRVLVARVSRAIFPGDSGDLALAAELITRASLTGMLADAREAAGLAEGVLQRGPGRAGEAHTWAVWSLVRAYCQISAATGDGALMEAALQVGQEAVQGADASTWQTWPLVTSLTLALVEQATQDGNTRRLAQAVQMVQQVSIATQARHESGGYKSDKQGDLFIESLFFTALLFKQHYDQTGDHSSLSTAAQYASAAASRGDASGRQRQQYGYSAAEILFASYQADGSPDALDNAITLVRGVLMSRGDSDGKPMMEERRFLAELLHARFGRDRHGRDQQENRKLLTELAREAGDYPDYPKLALLLTNAVSATASAASSPAEAHEAAGWARQALALSQPGSAAAAGAHYAAGLAILALHKHQGASGELEDGIAHFQAAVSLAADEDLRSGAAFQLARALILRDGRIDQNVIDGLAQAGGAQGAHRHSLASMRAAALLETARGKPVPSSPERAAAVALLREVALAEDADTELRTMAARGWGHEALELGDHAGAATAFRSAIDAQPWQMWLAKTPGERREQIRSLLGIGPIAATCAARAGMLEHSVESLERGRTIAWGQVMQMRRAARMAAEADPQLGERFREALTAQEGFARYVAPESYTEAWSEVGAYLQHLTETGPHPADLRLRLAQTWNEMVREARRIPGLEDVMRPPGAAQLRAAVQDGTVVLVNAHLRGSHALLVGPDRLDNVPLPGLEAEATARRLADFTLALYALNASDVDYSPELRRHIARTLDETRRWLWEAVAEPVLRRLGIVRPPQVEEAWPRIWWCPTGVLSGLPFHAAGIDGAPGSSVIDLVVSSYTVSLTALWQAPAPRSSPARSILVVSNDEVPGLPALPGIPREISALKAKFPGRVTSLHGAQATRAAVLQQIPRHEWLHLACHASPGLGEHPPACTFTTGASG